MDPCLTDMKYRIRQILKRIDHFQGHYSRILEAIDAVEAGALPLETALAEIDMRIKLIEGRGASLERTNLS